MTKYLTMQKRNITLLLTLLFVVILTVSGFAWNTKTVTVTADGQTQTIKTHLNSASGILHDAGIAMGAKDAILLSTEALQDGTAITVLRAFPVSVTVNGNTMSVMTVQRTARGLADELGYQAPNYIPVGEVNEPLTAGSSIRIAHVTGRSVKEREQQIDIQEIRQRDDTMHIGDTQVVQEGSPGIEQIQEEVLYEDGKEIKRQIIRRAPIKQMVPTIIKVGARDSVETSRGAMRYREVLTMEASAYLPGDGDGRGITATGTVAQRGVVAVDPDVIPLGTRLYIPGYGLAVAADTGGAIVGNRIDLLMEDYGEAMSFGRRSVEVYVLQ